MTTQPYDVVVFGATSFVGQILTRYLFEEFGLDGRLRWAAAGRSLPKLEEVRKSLGHGAGKLTLLQADADDEASLQKLCRSARVIVSTVGPYALYGEPLVRVCAETGTDYCDLTGEVQWMRRMIHKYEKAARASGARIVHNCGFDSIPSDLGVHYLQQQARARFGRHCTTVKMRVRSMRGTFSGGTVASLLNVLKEVKANPALRRELADPYSICPAGNGKRVRQADVGLAEYDPDFDAWIAPFVMSAINTRVVHRTNALLHDAYGPEFRYDEAVMTGRGLRGRLAAAATGAGLGAFMVAGSIGALRSLLERVRAAGTGRRPEPAGTTRGRLRSALPRPHQPGRRPAHARDRRSGSGLRLDRKNARPGGSMPRARHLEKERSRRLLDTRSDLRRPHRRTAAGALRPEVRSARQVDSETQRHIRGPPMPSTTEFLLPVLALVAWTLVMWFWLYATRIPAMKRMGIDPQEAAHPGTYAHRMPGHARSVADNYNHLHEQPTIFYALMFFIALTGGVTAGTLSLAWGYVGSRVVHSLVQSTINKVVVRFTVFAFGSLLLVCLTVRELIRVLG